MTIYSLILILVLLAGLLCSLVLTPAARSLARRWQLLDHPTARRKLHRDPIPLGGGVAVLLATMVCVSAAFLLPGEIGAALRASWVELAGLATAALIIAGVGLADDRHTLRGRQKLIGQIVAVIVLLYTGLEIREVHILGLHVELGLLSVAVHGLLVAWGHQCRQSAGRRRRFCRHHRNRDLRRVVDHGILAVAPGRSRSGGCHDRCLDRLSRL